MSRSYKHSPYSTDGHRRTTKASKRYANAVVRHYKKGLPNGKAYKKLYCSYDIHDWINRWSWLEAKNAYEDNNNVTHMTFISHFASYKDLEAQYGQNLTIDLVDYDNLISEN